MKAKNTNIINSYKKKQIAYNQQYKCNKCNKLLPPSYEIDHIIKRSEGGTNDLENLQALCRNCHGDKTWTENITVI